MKCISFSAQNSTEFTAILDAHPAATLALVFSCTSLNIEPFQEAARVRGIRLAGCSSSGEIHDGELTSGSFSGLLVELDAKNFVVWNGLHASVQEQALALGQEAVNSFANPAIYVLSGGLSVDGEVIVSGVEEGARRALTLFGGMAADDYSMKGTYCFSESFKQEHGIVAVIFDGDIVELGCQTTSGWASIGAEYQITRAEGNVVYEINNEPALPFFTRFFGELNNLDVDISIASVVSSQYPLQVKRKEGTVLRAPMLGRPDNAIVLAGGVRTGDRFTFSVAPGFEVIDETISYFNARKDESFTPDGVIMVSCKGRHAAFGPMLEDEIEGINDIYQVPMSGFLSYGEIGATETGQSALHNDTCCMISLREKS